MARKLRLEPVSVEGKLHWQVQEYRDWLIGWQSVGSTSSLESAKQIIAAMKEEH